jgi:hypothetical protein
MADFWGGMAYALFFSPAVSCRDLGPKNKKIKKTDWLKNLKKGRLAKKI